MLIGGRPKEADIRFTPYTRTQDLLRVHTLPAPPPHHLDKKKEKKKCVAGFDKRASHTQLVLVKNPSGDGVGVAYSARTPTQHDSHGAINPPTIQKTGTQGTEMYHQCGSA